MYYIANMYKNTVTSPNATTSIYHLDNVHLIWNSSDITGKTLFNIKSFFILNIQKTKFHNTYLLSCKALSVIIIVPSWNHSTFSIEVPVMEQLNIAVPPEFTIWTCGWMWTERKELTCKRISMRWSPNWFDALHTYCVAVVC